MNREETVKTVNNINNSSFPAFSLLGLIFVLCKIFEVAPIAAWSWWLVILPFFIPLFLIIAFVLLILVGAGVVLFIALLIDVFGDWKRKRRQEKVRKRIAEGRKNW